mmetsp:Transcript_20743/g.59118  ORF Transcript_20743/g.59118 Transcript_20743/m.59118 type:complete len:238 (+) Transcript_20743:1112-1825(+)
MRSRSSGSIFGSVMVSVTSSSTRLCVVIGSTRSCRKVPVMCSMAVRNSTTCLSAPASSSTCQSISRSDLVVAPSVPGCALMRPCASPHMRDPPDWKSEESSECNDRDMMPLQAVELLRGTTQKVWTLPLPLACTVSSRGRIQYSFPASVISSAVACEIWILRASPVLSIRDAMLTVSPKSWNLDFSPSSTPAMHGPLCNPIRKQSSPVSGPNVRSNVLVNSIIFVMHSRANFTMRTA